MSMHIYESNNYLLIAQARSRHNPHVLCSPIKTLLERNDRYLEIVRALGEALATTMPYAATPKPHTSAVPPRPANAPKQRSGAADTDASTSLLDLSEVLL